MTGPINKIDRNLTKGMQCQSKFCIKPTIHELSRFISPYLELRIAPSICSHCYWSNSNRRISLAIHTYQPKGWTTPTPTHSKASNTSPLPLSCGVLPSSSSHQRVTPCFVNGVYSDEFAACDLINNCSISPKD
jgi:hypothetical protein